MYYPSGYFKAKARDALKGCWQTALLIALIVNLPGLLAQGISVFTGNDPMYVTALFVILSEAKDPVKSPFDLSCPPLVFLSCPPLSGHLPSSRQ